MHTSISILRRHILVDRYTEHIFIHPGMKGISAEVWWNQPGWFVIWSVHRRRLPSSHWYGCHGKSTGLVHVRQKSDVLPFWVWFSFVHEIHSANSSTYKDRMTPAISRFSPHSPALETYRVLFFYSAADRRRYLHVHAALFCIYLLNIRCYI